MRRGGDLHAGCPCLLSLALPKEHLQEMYTWRKGRISNGATAANGRTVVAAPEADTGSLRSACSSRLDFCCAIAVPSVGQTDMQILSCVVALCLHKPASGAVKYQLRF